MRRVASHVSNESPTAPLRISRNTYTTADVSRLTTRSTITTRHIQRLRTLSLGRDRDRKDLPLSLLRLHAVPQIRVCSHQQSRTRTPTVATALLRPNRLVIRHDSTRAYRSIHKSIPVPRCFGRALFTLLLDCVRHRTRIP